MSDLKIKIQPKGGFLVVRVQGEIDYSNFKDFRDILEGQDSPNSSGVIINLERVNFLDSSGLGALVRISRKIQGKRGFLKLVGVKGEVLNLLKASTLDRYFDIYETEEDALGKGKE